MTQEMHQFILAPGKWLGEGKIELNMAGEELPFCTKWTVAKQAEGKIECLQEIQVKGLSEIMHNQFLFFDLSPGTFSLELDNPHLGKIIGKGVMTEQVIAWEFRSAEMGFEGFEMYEKKEEGVYLLHAEYATSEDLRTTIRGKVWQEK